METTEIICSWRSDGTWLAECEVWLGNSVRTQSLVGADPEKAATALAIHVGLDWFFNGRRVMETFQRRIQYRRGPAPPPQAARLPCADCKGKGTYVGFRVVEACRTCGGSGWQNTVSYRPAQAVAAFSEAIKAGIISIAKPCP